MKRFPFHKQHDSMLCGITCLQMICTYYGKKHSLETLSNYCYATIEGISILGLSEGANKLGLHSLCGRTTIDQLSKSPLPCILHWNQNHFIVLYKIRKNRNRENEYFIADPSKGLIKYREKDFIDKFYTICSNGEKKGVALFIQVTPAFFDQKEDSDKHLHSFRFLYGYIKQYRSYFKQIVLGLLVGSLLQLIFPFLTQAIVDIGIANQSMSFIWLILIGQLMLTLSRTIVDFIRRWILLHISMRINISLVSDFLIKLLKLPMAFFDSKLLGDLKQRINDHNRVENFLTTNLLSVMFSFLTFIIFGFVLFLYNINVFYVFIIGSLLYGVWISIFLKKRKILDYFLFEKLSQKDNKTYQFLTAIQEIKLQDCEQRRRWEWENIQTDLFGFQMKSLKLKQMQEAGGIFINEIKNIIITVLTATAVINGNMTLGMMLAVQYVIGQLSLPIDQLMNFIYSFQDVRISLERINEIHRKENEDKEKDTLTRDSQQNKSLSLENVGFRYNKHHPLKVINNVSIVIPEGKMTAIVGTSGSGKTTLIKLLLGYYPIDDGCIKIWGIPINKLNLKCWRRQCGVVMQDGVIFSESIARNIAVDDGEIDNNRLLMAAEIANIKDDILRLPSKFNTIVGRDGLGLSQGQKQRILIARAVYKNPEYIFLDEATNSLDTNNEKAIVENLDHFYSGRTVIVVAHRLSTVRNADQIIVLEKGHIVETGNHVSLVEKQGIYYELVKNQLELGN